LYAVYKTTFEYTMKTAVSNINYRVTQILAHFCAPNSFIKYRPIFKLFSLSESGENLQ